MSACVWCAHTSTVLLTKRLILHVAGEPPGHGPDLLSLGFGCDVVPGTGCSGLHSHKGGGGLLLGGEGLARSTGRKRGRRGGAVTERLQLQPAASTHRGLWGRSWASSPRTRVIFASCSTQKSLASSPGARASRRFTSRSLWMQGCSLSSASRWSRWDLR